MQIDPPRIAEPDRTVETGRIVKAVARKANELTHDQLKATFANDNTTPHRAEMLGGDATCTRDAVRRKAKDLTHDGLIPDIANDNDATRAREDAKREFMRRPEENQRNNLRTRLEL